MRTKVLLFALFTATLFGAATLITILFNRAPEGATTLLLFYGAVFVIIFGLVFFIGYGLNRYRFQALPPWQQTAAVSRYGALLGLFAVLILLVSAYVGLSWPLVIVLTALIVLGEILWRKRATIKLP